MGLFSKNAKEAAQAYQAELLRTHYDEVENMYEDMRRWRHNYRNHLQLLKALVAKKDLDGIENYLGELEEDLESIAPVIRTGNSMTDAIVNSKVSLAQSQGIEVICDAHVALQLKILEVDLCTIIGNLFDNAIEACMELPEEKRFIRIYMDMKNTQLYISFTNTTAQKKQKKFGEIFRSTKGKHRGLGLYSVDKLVEKYGGYLSRNSEDGAFTTEILLPNENPEEI